MTQQAQSLLDLVLVHSDVYGLWRFSDHSATQGRRFTHARDGIVTTNADGIVLAVNRAAERMFGHASQALIGRHVRELVPSAVSGDVNQVLGRRVAFRLNGMYEQDGSFRQIRVVLLGSARNYNVRTRTGYYARPASSASSRRSSRSIFAVCSQDSAMASAVFGLVSLLPTSTLAKKSRVWVSITETVPCSFEIKAKTILSVASEVAGAGSPP